MSARKWNEIGRGIKRKEVLEDVKYWGKFVVIITVFYVVMELAYKLSGLL